MNDVPVVLGTNRSGNASICLLHGSQLAGAIQPERLTRRKHHRGQPGALRQHCRSLVRKRVEPELPE